MGVKGRTRESVTQLLWLLNRILKDESKVAQEADAQAEEEAQEDARQVQVDRTDLFLDGNGGDGQYDDGRDTQTLKATLVNYSTEDLWSIRVVLRSVILAR